MANVRYETDDAVFVFNLLKVVERLDYYATEHKVDEAAQLLDFIAESSEECINIPEKYDYFGYISLDLLSNGEGSVICKTCNKTYQVAQINSTTVVHGKSPLSVNIVEKGQIKKLFGKKTKPPGMLGGRGYECPEGHTLISMITWRA